ncbi:extracellular solute-binding protein [Rhizobium brockwellii]|uniref:Extracellular solute-binding protein n=2 Tax=Rhizobium TaxID=379 RepID=A0ABU3YRY8_9HYPH|nr:MULTISPECIES: extracellular solute-binding protein [Rhizobium]MDV4181384.1 extracellular solute-binding protein [Rhizobium brockwellii]MDV4188598.1 extracellular solute-binding protein [Rhizobium brockwellii]NZD51520.1 extracellular solute-binding protein [Rhizobium leguminosarum]QIO49901.1 extracellular solute-binding protein [Rhizobium leguminosarum bv. trifolii]TAV75735.1 extracellular solute-binding protein [Rhizobium leguminosarum]
MLHDMTRRRFLGSAAAAGIAGTMTGFARSAAAGSGNLTAVEWGGDVVEAMKQIAADQNAATFNWVLHQGGAGAILPKIKAVWPNVDYDYVAGWEGSFNSMVKEDWLETINPADVPNLANIPEKIIIRDGKGNIKAVPRAVGGMYFGARTDTAPIAVKTIDDLLSPDLKGAICWPGPTQSMMLQIVALALHGGGSETNMEPGWKLMTELAKSGNIGRVAVTDIDFTNSLTSGETSVGFFAEPGWAAVAKNFPVTRFTKDSNFKAFLYQSGFGVLKNRPSTKATLDFVNFAISPDMNSLYAKVAGEAPLNSKAVTPDNLKHLSFTSDEFSSFVYVPDYNVVLEQQDAWSKRWEQDIAPLL